MFMVTTRYPAISFILDANMGYDLDQSVRFIEELIRLGIPVDLFEQPNDRFDLEGLRSIREAVQVPLAADEAVMTLDDAKRVIEMQAVDVINLKIMKSGVMETLRIIEITVEAGLDLMIGGMVESRIGMGCSFALAQAFPAIKFLDFGLNLGFLSSIQIKADFFL